MTFTRRICRGDKVYVYRVMTYREDGKVKQKTEYLGKEIKKGEKTIIKPPKHKCTHVRKILSRGAPIALMNRAKKFGLIKLIDQIFENYCSIKHIGIKIITIAINKILKDDAINNIGKWFESTSLSLQTPVTSDDFTPKKIRTILALLSSESPDYFGMIEQKIVDCIKNKYPKDSCMLVYDLTGITFYGKRNELSMYGHKYKKNGYHKQINLLLAITKEMKLPIHHRIVHGNILSVSTIHRLVAELEKYNMKDIILIVDRGFYSKRNMDELHPDYKVIGSLPSNLKIYKDAILKSKNIENLKYFFKYKNEIFFYKKIKVDEKNIFVFHSSQRYSEDLQNFLCQITEIEEHLKKIQKSMFISKGDMISELKNVCKEYFSYINFKFKRGWTFHYQLNNTKIKAKKKFFGKIVLFSTTELDPNEILKLYREKDVIEKTFQSMKHRGLQPLKTTTEETTRAYTKFIVLGYLLLALIKSKVGDNKLSIKKIIDNLSEVKEVLYQDGTTVVADITKQQREIMEQLEMM